MFSGTELLISYQAPDFCCVFICTITISTIIANSIYFLLHFFKEMYVKNVLECTINNLTQNNHEN